MWIVLLILVASTSPVFAEIYRCEGDDGQVLFTDRDCPGAKVQDLKPTSVVTLVNSQFSGLSELERQALQALETRLSESRQSSDRNRQRRASRARINREERQQNCARAKTGLARIQDKRRRGYKLAEAQALDWQQGEYEKMKRDNC